MWNLGKSFLPYHWLYSLRCKYDFQMSMYHKRYSKVLFIDTDFKDDLLQVALDCIRFNCDAFIRMETEERITGPFIHFIQIMLLFLDIFFAWYLAKYLENSSLIEKNIASGGIDVKNFQPNKSLNSLNVNIFWTHYLFGTFLHDSQ